LHIPEPYIVVTVIAVAFVLLWLIGGTVARRREKKLVDSRPSDNVEKFVAAFRSEVHSCILAGISEWETVLENILRRIDVAAVSTCSSTRSESETVKRSISGQSCPEIPNEIAVFLQTIASAQVLCP
jgi:hypothetical protein